MNQNFDIVLSKFLFHSIKVDEEVSTSELSTVLPQWNEEARLIIKFATQRTQTLPLFPAKFSLDTPIKVDEEVSTSELSLPCFRNAVRKHNK